MFSKINQARFRMSWGKKLAVLFAMIISSQSMAAPGDILYLNQFSNNGDVSSDWNRTGGGGDDFQASSNTFNSTPYALRIRDSSGGTSNSGLINATELALMLLFGSARIVLQMNLKLEKIWNFTTSTAVTTGYY